MMPQEPQSHDRCDARVAPIRLLTMVVHASTAPNFPSRLPNDLAKPQDLPNL